MNIFIPLENKELDKKESAKTQSTSLISTSLSTTEGSYKIESDMYNNRITALEKSLLNISVEFKQLCKVNCRNCIKNNITSDETLLCKFCGAFFCSSCIPAISCMKCKSVVCEYHSLKCNICHRRVCINSSCNQEISFCQMCSIAYCYEHFEDHKKHNQKELFKLRCSFERCKITQGIGLKGISELSKCLVHMAFIKELRLRTKII